MRAAKQLITLGIMLPLAVQALAVSKDDAVADYRARLAELGKFVIEDAESELPPKPIPPNVRTPRSEALYQLARAPREPVRKAIDQALRNGGKVERIGALALYNWIVPTPGNIFPKEPLNPAYPELLYRLLVEDDRTMPIYTGALGGGLYYYPMSRMKILAYMFIAQNATDPMLREDFLLLAAQGIGVELLVYKDMPELEKESLLSRFEAWFARHEKEIDFDKNGRSLFSGSVLPDRPRHLTFQERALIRKDPFCVLELVQGSTGGIVMPGDRFEELLGRCGAATFGPEGARLMQEMTAAAREKSTASFDQQRALTAARSKYPWIDAGLLAVAYVAADDPDAGHRDLAKKTLDDIGMPEDIQRVLGRESKEVRRKAEALADEMN